MKRKAVAGLGVTIAILLLVVVVAVEGQSSPWEAEFVKIPNRARAYESLAYYTSMPHIAGKVNINLFFSMQQQFYLVFCFNLIKTQITGSPEDYEQAVWTNNKFKSFGISSEIQPVSVMLSTPISRSLELVAPADQR